MVVLSRRSKSFSRNNSTADGSSIATNFTRSVSNRNARGSKGICLVSDIISRPLHDGRANAVKPLPMLRRGVPEFCQKRAHLPLGKPEVRPRFGTPVQSHHRLRLLVCEQIKHR